MCISQDSGLEEAIWNLTTSILRPYFTRLLAIELHSAIFLNKKNRFRNAQSDPKFGRGGGENCFFQELHKM
jgi:hypothetical protein